MLRTDEFQVGDLTKQPNDILTLLLPRSEYEHTALIGEMFDQRYGILLDGELPCQAYLLRDDEPWQGILVPGVVIEADERSAFDPAGGLETGALIREGTSLSLAAVTGPHPRVGRPEKVVLANELPPCEGREGVGFRRWRIVKGQGAEKQELFSVRVEELAKVRAATLATNRG